MPATRPTPGHPSILPAPGLDGTYRDTCVVCLRGTDTGLAFYGIAEWALAGMQILGLPDWEAEGLLAEATGLPVGTVPAGEILIALRVCTACVTATAPGLTVGLVPGEAPIYGHATAPGDVA